MEHPGSILKNQFLAPLAVSPAQLARDLKVHRSTISRLITGSIRLSPEMASRLGAYFGIPPSWWLDMQHAYDVAALSEYDVSGIRALEVGDDVLIGPRGVIRLAPASEHEIPPMSLPCDELLNLHEGSPARRRQVRDVTYESGVRALIGTLE